MNMFARFDGNPAMTLQDIKETKCYGRTHTRTWRDNVKTVYPPQTKLAGGYKYVIWVLKRIVSVRQSFFKSIHSISFYRKEGK